MSVIRCADGPEPQGRSPAQDGFRFRRFFDKLLRSFDGGLFGPELLRFLDVVVDWVVAFHDAGRCSAKAIGFDDNFFFVRGIKKCLVEQGARRANPALFPEAIQSRLKALDRGDAGLCTHALQGYYII